MLGCVPTVKHTRLGAYCTNMCVQPALQQEILLATQRLNVGARIKTFKKRMNLGGHTNMTTQRQKTKVYYSSVVSKARQYSNIDKNMAIRYFTKQSNRISANKSYADALKFGKDTSAKVKTNPLPTIHIKNSDPVKQGVQTRIVETPANHVNATTCFKKIYKKKSPVPITLHNRFNALNLIDTTDEVDIPSVCHKDAHCDENTGYAISESLQTQLGEQSYPVLERKSKIFFGGEKMNGCPDGANTHTKLGKTATNNCTSAISVVRDVSNDGHSRTHIVDSKEAFDKSYVLNSRDNVTHISCMMGVENESNYSNSVVHNLQFGFQPSEKGIPFIMNKYQILYQHIL